MTGRQSFSSLLVGCCRSGHTGCQVTVRRLPNRHTPATFSLSALPTQLLEQVLVGLRHLRRGEPTLCEASSRGPRCMSRVGIVGRLRGDEEVAAADRGDCQDHGRYRRHPAEPRPIGALRGVVQVHALGVQELRGDRSFLIFLTQCSNLIAKIQAKVADSQANTGRQRLLAVVGAAAGAIVFLFGGRKYLNDLWLSTSILALTFSMQLGVASGLAGTLVPTSLN